MFVHLLIQINFRIQRGTVYLKLGDYDDAEIDFRNVLLDDPNNQDASYLFSRLEPAREQDEQTKQIIDQGDYRTAIGLLTQLLEVSPWSTSLREARADCYIKEEDILSAVSDLRSVNRLSQDSTDGYYRLSTLLYQLGHASDALKEIRECLKLDPEHGDCFPFYKKIKKVDKALSDAQTFLEENAFADCIASAEKALKIEDEIPMIIFSGNQLLCTCYLKDEQYTMAIRKCGEAIELHKDPSVLCDRADAYLETEMFDDGKYDLLRREINSIIEKKNCSLTAVRDFQAALEIDESLKRAKEGIDRARKLQKQSERRDYYKILNVKKTATKQEIVKAYRKAAQKWHPDAYQGDEKKVAEKKFIDIAAAKEVLTDPEKRRRFDMGDDPLDPEANQGFQRGNPFQHFQQQGSPFQFKFHFN